MPTREDPLPRRRVRLLADLEDDFGSPGVTTEGESDEVAKVYFYDEVGGWGVWPDQFQQQLSRITAKKIELHLHSPGGDAFDGIAIYNMLKQHPADIHVVIDGLAASAASVIAMAGDVIEMSRGAQLMIHDAWGMTVGPAADMEKMAGELDKVSESIARIYQARAGGTVTAWRKAMRAETWYADKEAVEAGLATRVETKASAAKNRWDLAIFAHAGRDAAPEPVFPGGRTPYVDPRRVAPGVSPAEAAQRMAAAAKAHTTETPDASQAAGSTTNPKEGTAMAVDLTKLRDALGLTPEAATDEALNAFAGALSTALASQTPAQPPAPPVKDEPLPVPPALNAAAREAGAILLDPEQLRQLQASALKGEQAWAEMKRAERDQIIRDAIGQGKIAASREDYWRQLWDKDPDGTRQSIQDLAPNVIPVLSAGYLGDSTANASAAEMAYGGLYPEDGGR